MINIFFIVFAFCLTSCARVQTLNLEPHAYSERPKKILWIQVAGFSEEHIPLLKFNTSDANHKTALEQGSCMGKIWNYNLYELRPSARNSFLSQLSGSRNIKGTCEDYSHNAVWNLLADFNFNAGILENGGDPTQSLETALTCPVNNMLDIEKIRFWRMASGMTDDNKSFHYQDPPAQLADSMQPGLYYDRSCQKGLCFSSLFNNFKVLWGMLNKSAPTNIFIVRDFNFQNALKKKDINLAKESLQEIDRIISWAKKDNNQELLIVLSGAESTPVEYPVQGKEWAEFEKSGKNLIYKRSSLMSPVISYGAMAENFCGLYDESEMLKRAIHRPERKKFSWDYINPL